MQRRDFITLLGVAAVAWPLAARAPQPAKMKRSAIVHPATKVGDVNVSSGNRIYRVFLEELSRLGFLGGQNLVVERYSAEGSDRAAFMTAIVESAAKSWIPAIYPYRDFRAQRAFPI
jgi:putative tryptophan/tyrosine transport system substrate-binding protein